MNEFKSVSLPRSLKPDGTSKDKFIGEKIIKACFIWVNIWKLQLQARLVLTKYAKEIDVDTNIDGFRALWKLNDFERSNFKLLSMFRILILRQRNLDECEWFVQK